VNIKRVTAVLIQAEIAIDAERTAQAVRPYNGSNNLMLRKNKKNRSGQIS
jgi:hypothetical protein